MVEWDDGVHGVWVSANGTFSELKKGIEKLTKMEPKQQELVHKGSRRAMGR